ncbi:unnamed protein product [Allacma fusca]|uniref:Uncharacterized protein n=1 Tax=Allacma fusca TaxID=39272 RepID=A0A8J2KVS2_9HEXA|nr:unnamed protein product [Allacma fusca]
MGNRITKPKKILADRENSTRVENKEHKSVESTVPTSSVTSTGMVINGSLQAEQILSVVNSGDNNTYNYNSRLPAIQND